MNIMVIGAHIDDCEVIFSGASIQYVNAGHKVVFVAMASGEMGHHIMSRKETAERRKKEGLASGKILGVKYEFLDLPECEITPTVEYRNQLVALMRKHSPDIVVTHPLIDYHPDHRCTAELVLDASFMVKVPKVVPEIPPMRKDTCFFFSVNRLSYAEGLKPAFCIPIDSVFDQKILSMHQHESQMYEWLPWVNGMDKPVPDDEEGRIEFITEWRGQDYINIADRYRELLVKQYGDAGKKVKYAEMLFMAPYGRQMLEEEFGKYFPFTI